MRLFLSYSRDDKAWVYELWRALREKAYHDAWIDRGIVPAQDWWNTISEHIEACECFIYVMTPRSVASIYCRTEVDYALALNKPIIPLMLKTCDYPSNLKDKRVQCQMVTDDMGLGDVLLIIERALSEVRVGQLQGKYQLPLLKPPRPNEPQSNLRTSQKSAQSCATYSSVYDIVSPPFAWIEIPAGAVTLEAGGYLKKPTTFNVPSFAIAKYPITNAQYAKFVEADGYRQRKWWTAAGWNRKVKNGWESPSYWRQAKWNKPDNPVVGISWYEAVAFCLWLSDVTGEKIMLPTEQQWQRAAQGDDGRAFPWGNEWDGRRCNNDLAPYMSDGTTPVTEYESEGYSPFGVVDMAGNVLEWCLTNYNTGANKPSGTESGIVRGGSWNGVKSSDGWRVTARKYIIQREVRSNDIGFRCIRLD